MENPTTWKLREAAASTFEQLGFFFPDEEPYDEQLEAPVAAVARVRFRGPIGGVLELRLAGDLLGPLAQNMLAADVPPDHATCLDAFGEMANVICGNVLPALVGSQAVFDLEPPEVSTDPQAWPRFEEITAYAVFGIEEGRAEAVLHIAEGAEVVAS
ncbi:MAG: hypothetical protein D6701_08625 [Gemmatimonadetes bacterium]|nr:MAG: hypothetical protein D6701_08625 [Gemmatimonadota bacterium]